MSKHIVWDLHPFQPNATASGWDDLSEQRPKDGLSFCIQRSEYTAAKILSGEIEHREIYYPTDDEIELVWQFYRSDEPKKPAWPHIRAKLRTKGHSAAEIVDMSVLDLLAILKSAEVAGSNHSQDNHGTDDVSTLDRAKAYIQANPGKKQIEIARHLGIELSTFKSHHAKPLREAGYGTRPRRRGYYPPE